jgi:ABC-type Mn2+/Zn2+ transport system permease subunit
MLATVWSALGDPWGQELLRRAFLEVLLLGIAGGALGAWVVAYRLSYSAESLAHAMLPGLVVAALTGLPLLLGGAAGILVAAVSVALAGRVRGLGRDTGVAVVVTTLFGLGALLALSPRTPAGLAQLLFGDVLGVSDGDLWLAGALVVVVLGALRVLHGRLLVLGFDRTNARALGVAPLPVDAALLVLVAMAIVVAVQGLGSLLVVAVLVAPAAAAGFVTDRMGVRIALGALVAVLAGAAGLYLSYYADVAAGASVALALVAACALAWLSSRRPRRSPGTRPAG